MRKSLVAGGLIIARQADVTLGSRQVYLASFREAKLDLKAMSR
jgi:hypothetical protein